MGRLLDLNESEMNSIALEVEWKQGCFNNFRLVNICQVCVYIYNINLIDDGSINSPIGKLNWGKIYQQPKKKKNKLDYFEILYEKYKSLKRDTGMKIVINCSQFSKENRDN